MPQVYKAYFGTKFYMPVEYDLMIYFAPKKAESGVVSKSGKLRLRSWLQAEGVPEEEQKKSGFRFGLRPGEKKEDYPFLLDETYDKDEGPTTATTKTNWDGETIEAGEWYD